MAKEYDVVRITPMVRPGEGGGIENFFRHTIRTKGGTILYVEVPEKDFTAEKVGPILQAKAIEADKILKL